MIPAPQLDVAAMAAGRLANLRATMAADGVAPLSTYPFWDPA